MIVLTHGHKLLFNKFALQVYKVSTTATEELPIFSNLNINSKGSAARWCLPFNRLLVAWL